MLQIELEMSPQRQHPFYCFPRERSEWERAEFLLHECASVFTHREFRSRAAKITLLIHYRSRVSIAWNLVNALWTTLSLIMTIDRYHASRAGRYRPTISLSPSRSF